MTFIDKIENTFAGFSKIRLVILFGSFSRGDAGPDSDLDVAVAADRALSSSEKMELIEALSEWCGRPIDLIDLQIAGGLVLHRALTTGRLIRCTDYSLYAEIIKKMLFSQADFMPYRNRILAERRFSWIGK
ncbi:MAG: type VII toxin-antitoxin system MntA family adenylyltransferase antitoxin [Gammaproteobacteria bacterium]